MAMTTLLRAIAAALCLTAVDAASIRISGTLTWKIQAPNCTFKLDGGIQNLSPTGTTSGTLKMILWATPAPFPSKGEAIAEYNLGVLGGGYQIDSFKHKVQVSMPKITGNYYFTIAILEYTTSGWLNRDYVTTGRKLLDNGRFVTGFKWRVPTLPVINPPQKLLVGQKLILNPKADEDFNQIVSGTIAKTNVTIQRKGKASVEVASYDWDDFYTYTLGKSNLNGQKVPLGKLYLDPVDFTGSSTLKLYFQSPTSGVYRNDEENPDGGGTTWGAFTLK